MKRFTLAAILVVMSSAVLAADASLPSRAEEDFIRNLQEWEAAKTDGNDAAPGAAWTLRSGHLVFGMPRLTDTRHEFKPEGFDTDHAGISVVVREGFVVAHFDRMKSPLWVAQRWTKYDLSRMLATGGLGRPWREDLDLPAYARGGVAYDGNDTRLDRGHMARHAKNRAWGEDVSSWGVKMSNSTPQHRSINRGPGWRDLEDEVRDIVSRPGLGIEAIWVISGAIFRDKQNSATESPEDDFQDVVRITRGFGVPDATYKVVGWFDSAQHFQARAYVFEQPHEARVVSGEQRPEFELPDQSRDPNAFIVSIDELEERLGVDFFPTLQDETENLIEAAVPDDMWSSVQ